MITYVELLVLVVYAAMAGYIVYLQSRLKASENKRRFLEMVIVDVIEGNVSIRREQDGFSIHKTERTVNGEA
jgi:hypothetical protein